MAEEIWSEKKIVGIKFQGANMQSSRMQGKLIKLQITWKNQLLYSGNNKSSGENGLLAFLMINSWFSFNCFNISTLKSL